MSTSLLYALLWWAICAVFAALYRMTNWKD